MPKKPCHCSNCKDTLRDPKTIKAHIRKEETLLNAQKVWQDKNELEHAKRRRAAGTDEESSRERDERSAVSKNSTEDDDYKFGPVFKFTRHCLKNLVDRLL